MKQNKKVLIVKTGFSEFLDKGISTTVSLGDVLFCTTLLHLYQEDHVTWLTSAVAKGLLKDNPYINRLLIFGPSTFQDIAHHHYDILINLEKDIGICAFLKQIEAKKKYGFHFDKKRNNISTYKYSTRYFLAGQEHHKDIPYNSAEILYQTVDKEWNNQGIIINRKKRKKQIHDIGFNYAVGSKWPTKAWPMAHWKSLEKRLQKDFTVSWQKGHKNIRQYINWVDSCRIIVTGDSLGQMIAQALGKKAITLFGSTNHKRMARIPNIFILPSKLKCRFRPCYLPVCKNKKFCMAEILPKDVEGIIRRIFKK